MKKMFLLALLIIISYEAYIIFIKSSSFPEAQVSFHYDKSTMSINDLGDSLVAHHMIPEKISFTLLAPLFDIQNKIIETNKKTFIKIDKKSFNNNLKEVNSFYKCMKKGYCYRDSSKKIPIKPNIIFF